MSNYLRNYQIEFKDNIYKSLETGHKSVLAMMAPGLGKTRVICSICQDWEPSGVCVIAHREELLDQASLDLAEIQIYHNVIGQKKTIKNIISSHRHNLRRHYYRYNARVACASVQSLVSRSAQHKKWCENIKMVIIDEGHHALKKNQWGEAASLFPSATIIGFTGTAKRLDGQGLGVETDGIFDDLVIGPSCDFGIKDKWLCDYRVALPESEIKSYLGAPQSGHDYTVENCRNAIKKAKIIGKIYKEWSKHAYGKQTIAFAPDIKTGEEVEQEFLNHGVCAKLLTGETESQIRKSTMDAFKKKDVTILINVDLFDEGLNVVGIECVDILRPTKSLSKHRQMISRGLRKAQGKDYLIIIDRVGNTQEHGFVDDPILWSLERKTKRQQKINRVKECIACLLPISVSDKICRYCGAANKPDPSDKKGERLIEHVDGDLTLLTKEQINYLKKKLQIKSPQQIYDQTLHKTQNRAAAMSVKKSRIDRIATQKKLSDVIALFGGKLTHQNFSDAQIHREYYSLIGETIYDSLSKKRVHMDNVIKKLEKL